VRDIARAIGVAPSIAQRLIATLTAYGFAEQDPTLKYRIGVQAQFIGNAYVSTHALVRAGMAELGVLAGKHQLNGYLGVLRGTQVLYLIALQSSGPIAIRSSPGARTHLHSTALGKAILAEKSDDEVARLLGPQPFARLTPRSRLRLAPILAELHLARRNGYAISDEENLIGVFAIGAAVRDAAGSTVAAISGALPRHQVNRTNLPKLCKLIQDAANRISVRLGAPQTKQ